MEPPPKAWLDLNRFTAQNDLVMSLYETLLNLVAILFWFAFWNPDSRDIFFNPYVLKIRSFADALIDSIKPFVGRHVSRRMLTALLLLSVLCIKGVLYYSGVQGSLSFGIESSLPGIVSHNSRTSPVPQWCDPDHAIAPFGVLAAKYFLFSCASFGVFVFVIWSVAIIYLGARKATGLSRAEGTLFSLAKPLTSVTPLVRPFLLLGLGIAILAARALFKRGIFPLDMEHSLLFLAKALLSTVAAWVDVLPYIVTLLGALIVGAWISMFTMSASVGLMCREWLDLFLGPFRNHPIRIGIVDVSPVVLAFVLLMLGRILQYLVLVSYYRLL